MPLTGREDELGIAFDVGDVTGRKALKNVEIA